MGQHGTLSSQELERTACTAALPLQVARSSSSPQVGAAWVHRGSRKQGRHKASGGQTSEESEAQQGRTKAWS